LDFPVTDQLHTEGERILRYGTFEFDFQSRTFRCSSGVYELLEYPAHLRPQLSLERYLEHLICEDPQQKDPDTMLAKMQDLSAEYTQVHEAVTYTGTPKWVQVWGKRVYDAHQRPIKDVGIIRDITRQHHQEQSARRHLDELHRSNRELEDFAYVASHDLQEPLRKISTFCGRLYARYHEQLDREGSQYIDRIMASADSMRELIQNLLDYSRISQTDEALKPTRLDVILIGIQSDLELIIEETHTTILVDLGLPVIMGHAPMLTQLFTNLFTNAIKFRKPDAPPEIQITTSTPTALELAAVGLDPHSPFVCVNVIDNGIGFDPVHAERIFQVFQRLHGKSEFPGTGIGLAICRKIAERHGGTLIAFGEEMKGARFSIYFPAPDELPV
jgi:signal transduction histidine kinase